MQIQCVRTGRTNSKKSAQRGSALEDPALDASIRHWWENARLHDLMVSYGIFGADCALCQVRRRNDEVQCDMQDNPCPIYMVTERNECRNTPWSWVSKGQVHPVVMAWWLEDLKAGYEVPVSKLCPMELSATFPYSDRRNYSE